MIQREAHLRKLIENKHNHLIKIVTGMRRSGKSTLLLELFTEHLRSCGVSDEHIIVVDLEDRRNRKLRNPDALIEYIDGQMKDSDMYYVLLDEVQNVECFADVLNSYLKVKNADVYVTGSNSRFLSKDVATEFRGRGVEIKVTPLSFKEFYSVCAELGETKELAFEEYLTYGGLPKILDIRSEEGKAEYLQNLFETTYLKDIKERYTIKNEAEFEELLNILASSIGALNNPTKLANTFKSVKKVELSAQTIDTYINVLQDVFLIEKSIRYDIKGKSYISTPMKCYFTDLGLRNARINFRQNEITHLMENLIYNELRMRGLNVDVGVVVQNTRDENGKSVRKQLEVDFVCNQGSKRYYIQSALSLPSEEKREQEVRSLKMIKDNFQKFVITEDPIKKYQDENGITFINIFEFLLNEDCLKVV